MSASNATQREVIERLSVVLRPARATLRAAPHEPRRSAAQGHVGVPRSELLPGIRSGAIQQRYRLYRACGYGVASALYLSARSPNW
jgi:hypothetical protein